MKFTFVTSILNKSQQVVNRENTIFDNGQTSTDFENISNTTMGEANILIFLQVKKNNGYQIKNLDLNLTEFNRYADIQFV